MKLYLGLKPVVQLYVAKNDEEALKKHKEYVYSLTQYTKEFKEDEFVVKSIEQVEGYTVKIS
jgi:hypothetical protein